MDKSREDWNDGVIVTESKMENIRAKEIDNLKKHYEAELNKKDKEIVDFKIIIQQQQEIIESKTTAILRYDKLLKTYQGW